MTCSVIIGVGGAISAEAGGGRGRLTCVQPYSLIIDGHAVTLPAANCAASSWTDGYLRRGAERLVEVGVR